MTCRSLLLDLPLPDALDLPLRIAAPALLLALALLLPEFARAPRSAWQWLTAATVTALAATLGALGQAIAVSADAWQVARDGALVLVAFIGWVVTRFAARYLTGEPRQAHFARCLAGTLGAAMLVIATDHLLVLCLAWLTTSLCLQKLLVFYPERPAARLAALEKFVVSRSADACMGLCTALLVWHHGTFDIDLLRQRAGDTADAVAPQLAAVLIAVAVVLKSAQLPFHGWLLKVMEAPTPVSALLHAGVVNLGGFVLIRLAPIVEQAPLAQVLLVGFGAVTAACAGLIATTRTSIKDGLAWSTCAQMGFMVLQCGLGLYEMAWLHLVAHSLYKAHCFLTAGDAVRSRQVAALLPPAPAPSAPRVGAALLASAAIVLAAAFCWGEPLPAGPGMNVAAAVILFALAPLLAMPGAGRSNGAVLALFTAFVWFGLHRALHAWTGGADSWLPTWLAAAAIACFAVQFAVQTLAWVAPRTPLALRLRAALAAGLGLDLWLTRFVSRFAGLRAGARHDAAGAAGATRNLA